MAWFAGSYGASAEDIALAVTEAVANAIRHGYASKTDEPVYVEADADEDGVVVRVHDRGIGMRPSTKSSGAGFGLPLLGNLADHVAIYSSDSGVSVEMRFDRRTL